MRINTVANQPQFGNLPLDGIIKGLQACEKTPMLNVSVIDLTTAIIPRTAIETFCTPEKTDANGKKYKEPNVYAGLEALRRESSGLIVNCLIPGFIAQGIAKVVQKPVIGAKTNLAGVSANTDLLEKIGANYTGDVPGTLKKMLLEMSGVDGKQTKVFKDILGADFDFNKPAKELYGHVVKSTGVADNIKFAGDEKFFSSGLEAVLTNTQKVLQDFEKTGMKNFGQYIDKAKKLVKGKSLGALAFVIPLAISMQPLNRWITRKTSGKEGSPIHADFMESDGRKLDAKEKSDLLRQKFISVGSMIGVALMSMGFKKPNMKMFEFKGPFPTMDQARLISTATFSSRMASAEDADDLREATVRDIVTFSGMYFLGDYVAKGIATGMEKFIPGAKLINDLKPLAEGATTLQKAKHWVKNTALKSSDEVGAIVTDASQKVNNKNLRALCQLGNLGFSLVVLGAFVPIYNRTKTNRKTLARMEEHAAPARYDFMNNAKVRFLGS